MRIHLPSDWEPSLASFTHADGVTHVKKLDSILAWS